MAPESFFDNTWDLMSDVWMFGVLLWGTLCLPHVAIRICQTFSTHTELFSFGEMPWPGVADLRVMTSIRQREKLARPAACPTQVYQVMLGCWVLEPGARLTAQQAHEAVELYCQQASVVERLTGQSWPDLARIRHASQASQLAQDVQEYGVNLNSAHCQRVFDALEVDRDRLVLQQELGAGQFGSVHLGVLASVDSSTPPRSVAVKQLKNADSEMQQKFVTEAKLLALVKHQHVVQLVGVVTKSEPYVMVMELMGGGDLQKYLKKRKDMLSTDELTHICVQVCSGMEHLARLRVVHRDLAARCVFAAIACVSASCDVYGCLAQECTCG